jgi:hypothetical protein
MRKENWIRMTVDFIQAPALVMGLIVALSLVGCAGNGPNGDMQQYTLQITKRSEYFKTSPEQPTPPDGRLDEGTRVRVIQMSGEYSKIETTYGLQAWVSSFNIGPIQENTYQPTGG